MPTIPVRQSRVASEIDVTRKGKTTFLNFTKNDTAVMFFDGQPVGVLSAGYFYSHGAVGPSQAAFNAWAGDGVRVALDGPSFDFVVAQTFIHVALPLTKRPDADTPAS